MSYKVLARKWRPQHFRDMLGQEPVLRALISALDTNRLHHAYLFTGMRGVGKTTIARILAKCLNCETNGVSSDPCGTCSTCVDIDAGRFFDLIEVDAASRTKVESTRELLENVPYAPASGRYKVYLIDEVHMFSAHSFNALLKTLEEPPEHVKFLLATTDPQKVPATVLSRCLQFNLKRMSHGALRDYLAKILTEESIEHELPALDLIARASEGSVRDSLSLVEQAAAVGEGAVRAGEVENMLGRASVERLLELIDTLARGDLPALFSQVDELAQYAPEFSEILGEILSLLHSIAMLKSVPGSVSESTPGSARLLALSESLDPDTVQLFYQIGLHARRDMPFAPDTREAFDMALLRMHAFKPSGSPVTAINAKGSLEAGMPVQTSPAQALKDAVTSAATDSVVSTAASQVAIGMSSAPVSATPTAPSPGPARAQQQVPEAVTSVISPEQPENADKATSARDAEQSGNSDKATPAASAEQPKLNDKATAARDDQQASPVASSIDKSAVTAADWPQMLAELDIAGMPLQLASHCIWSGMVNDRVTLQLTESEEHLGSERFTDRLRTALSHWFGREMQLVIELTGEQLHTPARIAQKQADENLAAAQDSIRKDPLVQQLINGVDGAVDEASIRPLQDR